MINSGLCNDSKLTSLEVTECLRIPICSDSDLKKNFGREGELKYNVTSNCLIIRTPNEWKKLFLKPYEQPPKYAEVIKPSAPPQEKTMQISVVKKCLTAEFVTVVETLIYQQINFLIEEAKRLKLKKILIANTNSESVSSYLKSFGVDYEKEKNGTLTITV
jgi:hypothetical protein